MYGSAEEMAIRLRALRDLTQHPAYYWTATTQDGLPRPAVVAFGVVALPAAYWQTVRAAADPDHEMV